MVTLKTSDSSEALERWSLVKTSLQLEPVHTPHPPILPSCGHILQMRVQCKPQKCCPLKGLTFPTAASPSNGWCTNFPWVYRDWDQTPTGLEMSNEHGTALRGIYKPKGHLQLQRCLLLSPHLEKCLFSQGFFHPAQVQLTSLPCRRNAVLLLAVSHAPSNANSCGESLQLQWLFPSPIQQSGSCCHFP